MPAPQAKRGAYLEYLSINSSAGQPSADQTKRTMDASVFETICIELMNGKSLTQVLRQPGMPSRYFLTKHLNEDEQARKKFEEARNIGYQFMFDEILDEMNDTSQDVVGGRGNAAAVNRSRLKVETMKWALARMLPKLYGDAPTQTNVTVNNKLSEDDKFELARWMAFELTKATKHKEAA